jgi:hypothetical protein
MILVLIEIDVLKRARLFFRKPLPPRDFSIEVDSDVDAEEERLCDKQNDVVRVFGFRK